MWMNDRRNRAVITDALLSVTDARAEHAATRHEKSVLCCAAERKYTPASVPKLSGLIQKHI